MYKRENNAIKLNEKTLKKKTILEGLFFSNLFERLSDGIPWNVSSNPEMDGNYTLKSNILRMKTKKKCGILDKNGPTACGNVYGMRLTFQNFHSHGRSNRLLLRFWRAKRNNHFEFFFSLCWLNQWHHWYHWWTTNWNMFFLGALFRNLI